MFISDRFKLVFLEVPRTGSNSITAALSELDPDSPTVAARADNKFFDYHNFNIPEHADGYLVIAAHRNPYARLWSHFKHRKQHGNPQGFGALSWDDYLQWAITPQRYPALAKFMRERPIMEMRNTDRVSCWLRFESLADDWASLARAQNWPEISVPHVNASGNSETLDQVYDDLSAAQVYLRFKADFEHFGYLQDSWTGAGIIT